MELPPEHTAVLFHWPAPPTGARGKHLDDRLFIYPGIIHGEPLHQLIDILLDEHCGPYGPISDAITGTELVTEVILYWHFADGTWSYDDYVSHLAMT